MHSSGDYIIGLLGTTLQLAVPLWVEKIKSEQWSFEKRRERAEICAYEVAAKGDVLQFGGRKGEAGQAFNMLAEGLALLAMNPGGITFMGIHWESVELASGRSATEEI